MTTKALLRSAAEIPMGKGGDQGYELGSWLFLDICRGFDHQTRSYHGRYPECHAYDKREMEDALQSVRVGQLKPDGLQVRMAPNPHDSRCAEVLVVEWKCPQLPAGLRWLVLLDFLTSPDLSISQLHLCSDRESVVVYSNDYGGSLRRGPWLTIWAQARAKFCKTLVEIQASNQLAKANRLWEAREERRSRETAALKSWGVEDAAAEASLIARRNQEEADRAAADRRAHDDWAAVVVVELDSHGTRFR